MSRFSRVAFSVLLSCCVAAVAFGQRTGGQGTGGGGGPRPAPLMLQEPSSQTAAMARSSMDLKVKLGEFECELDKLGDLLTEILEVAVFVDHRAIEMAGLSAETVIAATLPELPMRSALRRLLQPHGLRVVVEEEGLTITADFTELTRRGVATDRWVDEPTPASEQIHIALKKTISFEFVQTPLDEAVAVIGEAIDLPIMVDAPALEEIGVDSATPVTVNLKNVSTRSFLRLMLRSLYLTYIIRDNVLQITSREAAEQNLVGRIYFLEGTGIPIGGSQIAMDLIQKLVVPDTWESLGGPSTIASIPPSNQSRPALVISTSSDVHEQIESLLKSLRESQVGPDPRAVSTQP